MGTTVTSRPDTVGRSPLLLAGIAAVALSLLGCTESALLKAFESAALTVDVKGGGAVVADPSPSADKTYTKGSSVTLNAVGTQSMLFFYLLSAVQEVMGKDSLNAWFFSKWGEDASGTTNPLTITMDRDRAVSAEFNHSGIKKIVYSPAIFGSPLIGSTSLSYDANGRLTQTFDFDSVGTEIKYTDYAYNAAGQCTQYTVRNPNGTIFSGGSYGSIGKYLYTSSGALSEIDFYNSSSVQTYSWVYTFNSTGQYTGMVYNDVINGHAQSRFDMYYDKLQRFTSMDGYTWNGSSLSLQERFQFLYDSNGFFYELDMADISGTYTGKWVVANDSTGTPQSMQIFTNGALTGSVTFNWQAL